MKLKFEKHDLRINNFDFFLRFTLMWRPVYLKTLVNLFDTFLGLTKKAFGLVWIY